MPRRADDFPIAVIQDRYQGCYSRGAWLAIAAGDHLENGAYRVVRCLEAGPHGDDTDAALFWSDPPWWIAVGDTPDKAVEALRCQTSRQEDDLLSELDVKIAVGTADLEAGRLHDSEEVRAYVRLRFRDDRDAAE